MRTNGFVGGHVLELLSKIHLINMKNSLKGIELFLKMNLTQNNSGTSPRCSISLILAMTNFIINFYPMSCGNFQDTPSSAYFHCFSPYHGQVYQLLLQSKHKQPHSGTETATIDALEETSSSATISYLFSPLVITYGIL